MNRMTERVPIESIVVGNRLREDFGDIRGLAESIAEFGLLHPLTVDAENNLIAGERRLRAMRDKGFLEVEIRRWGTLDSSERRLIELEENIRRKDLTEIERSRKVAEVADLAREIDIQSAQDNPIQPVDPEPTNVLEFRAPGARNSRRGRPTEPGSLKRQSEMTGIPAKTIDESRAHKEIAEHFPALSGLGKKDSVKVARKLNAMEPEERKVATEKLKVNDSATITSLTDRPAMPQDDSPEVKAATKAGWRFRDAIGGLYTRIADIKRFGGIPMVTADWSDQECNTVIFRINETISVLASLREDLKGTIDERHQA